MDTTSNTAGPVEDINPGEDIDAAVVPLDPILEQYQTENRQEYWIKELKAARDERHAFDGVAVKTIQRYSDQRSNDYSDQQNRYNLFYANTEIKMAALYSHTPEADVRRRFMDANDAISRVAANIVQRATFIEMELDNFDQKFKQMLFDYLVPGVGVGWVRLEQEEGEPNKMVVTDPITGEQTLQDDPAPNITEQLTHIDYVAWDDFLWAPCQVWTDCRWIARRVPMNRDAIKARFGETAKDGAIASINYEKKKSSDGTEVPSDKLKPTYITQSTTDVYEIWDRECECIYWICESSPTPLDVKEDTNNFPGFFPTPLPPLGRFTTSSTIPRSDFSLTQDQYDMLDELQSRATNLIECIKVKFVYDASRPEIGTIFTTLSENTGVGVNDWQNWQSEKGGLANAIQFVPIQDFVSALSTTQENIQTVKQNIFDIEGIADYMRGETQAYDSAAAINQKGTFAGNRLGTIQKAVAQYVEKLVRLKVHLMTKFYKPEILIDHAGALPDEDRQYFGPAMQLLKSDFAANFRLSVSVDSIQDASWNNQKAERTTLVQTIGEMIATVLPQVKQNPDLGPLAVELIKFAIAGYKGSAAIEGILDSALQKMLADAASAQKKPPPPNPAEIKAQSEAQKSQVQLQIAQMQEDTKRQKDAAESQNDQVNARLEQMRLQLEQFKVMSAHHATAVEGAHNKAMDVALLGKP
jgi:hypothetical protein